MGCRTTATWQCFVACLWLRSCWSHEALSFHAGMSCFTNQITKSLKPGLYFHFPLYLWQNPACTLLLGGSISLGSS